MKDLVIRGEFIIKKNTFQEKYAGKFANPRNLVAGIVNQKTKDAKKYNDIDFVAYELIKYPNMDEIKPRNKWNSYNLWKLTMLEFTITKTKLTNDAFTLKD